MDAPKLKVVGKGTVINVGDTRMDGDTLLIWAGPKLGWVTPKLLAQTHFALTLGPNEPPIVQWDTQPSNPIYEPPNLINSKDQS